MTNENAVTSESAPENEQAVNETESATVVDETEALEASAEEESTEVEPESEYVPDEELTDKARKRINKLVWEKSQLKREYEAKLSELNQQKPAEPVVSAEKPKLSDFDYDTERYADAVAGWRAEQIIAEKLRGFEAKFVQQEQQKTVTDFQSKQLKYAQEHQEYSQLVSERSIAIDNGSAIEQFILGSKHGPELHHKLLDDITTLERIKLLPEYMQGAELARLESTLKPRIQKSAAPKPVQEIESVAPKSKGRASPLSRLSQIL